MLKVRIIPCLDVAAGRVVKGVNFVDLIDAGDPVAQAKIYDSQGADELCFLDITASVEKRDTLYEVVTKVAKECFMPLTVGGGVKTLDDIQKLLQCGADKVAINTAAIFDPELVRKAAIRFGSQCIVVAMDAKKVANGTFELFTHGGRKETGINALVWAKRVEEYGAGEILLTSMDKDGTKDGFDLELNRLVADNVGIPLIASGGVGKLEHFVAGVKEGKASALLAASVFHFGTFSIGQVKDYMQENSIPVRMT